MDNLTLRYFDAEMRYLREAGKEFAEAFPDRAAQLNLDKPGAQDPYVERLFEGFAFLMGRLREKLDDEMVSFAWSATVMLMKTGMWLPDAEAHVETLMEKAFAR